LSLACSIKAYHDAAVAAGIPALTTAGIYPGTSNVMAAHILSIARGEYDENFHYKEPAPGEQPQGQVVMANVCNSPLENGEVATPCDQKQRQLCD
jgi:hypothetical protein